MWKSKETPVLVVGGGPAGLTTAIALGRYGVECLLVERRPEPSSHPRSTVVSTRTMELLRLWGLDERVLAGGVEVDWLMWRCETLARAADGTAIEVGLPTRAQAAVISPTAPACASQHHLETVLRDDARSLDSVRVEVGVAVVGLESTAHGVHVTLRDPKGRERVVTARYVVGADGARSIVRAAIGIPMRGSEDVVVGVTALLRAPLWALLGDRRYGFYATTRGGEESSFFPAGPDDRWLFGYQLEPGVRAPRLPAAHDLAERIGRAAGIDDLEMRIDQIGSFSSAAQLADRFRHDRIFLVGDAAHRVTPRGGTGMNTAIHDGYDLGWKLAWVLRGWANAELLDSYELERRPVAAHTVARSADPRGTRRSPGEELRVDLGGRIGHHWIAEDDRRRSTLDLLGPGLTLLTGIGNDPWRAAAESVGGDPPLAVERLDEITARALGIRPRGALLVRPDGIPAASWAGDVRAESALRRAIRDLRSPRPDALTDADAA